ncbi:MAG TPA: 4-alpha-glucanotransferase, partial [Kofleriaceae bacterium]
MIADKLARLGVRRLLLAIHDASFPADPDEAIGRGSPNTRAAGRLFEYASGLGFNGIQLGPQGQTSRDNASPYDAMIFSRDVAAIAWRDVVGDAIAPWLIPGHSHAHAWDAAHALLAAAYRDSPELAAFRQAHHEWLDVDAMYGALAARYGGTAHRDWPAEDRDRWAEHSPLDPRARRELGFRIDAVRDPLLERKLRVHHATLRERVDVAEAIGAYAFGQMIAHEQHWRTRQRAARVGLVLYGDFQVGYSDVELWAYRSAFLEGYRMGAPPSRTNPAGQPWGFPVLDPDQYEGRAGELLEARIGKALAEYDGVRIDHPHGLVCPWVYRVGTGDDGAAVRGGARLHESPDLTDHPALAVFTYVRPEQIDRAAPRYADGWVKGPLEAWQIDAYAQMIGKVARATSQVSCEVLSTMPAPLGAALAKFGLGRWRVAQKANLGDDRDVYRME